MKKALVLAGSRGIGKGIADSLKDLGVDVDTTNSKTLDTSNIKMVNEYLLNIDSYDILVLNTGGPAAKDFMSIKEDEWNKYHDQLFLSFCLILQNIKINDGGYIFLISSFNIKEPDPKLILSNAYRIAFSSVFKSLSKKYAKRAVNCINIAPGPIKTDRLEELVDNMEEFEKTLPMGRAGTSKEIGDFVKSIIENEVKYLSGVTINFDGAASNSLF